jgi:hypothetical protein
MLMNFNTGDEGIWAKERAAQFEEKWLTRGEVSELEERCLSERRGGSMRRGGSVTEEVAQ